MLALFVKVAIAHIISTWDKRVSCNFSALIKQDVSTPCADMYAAVRVVADAEGRMRQLHCA